MSVDASPRPSIFGVETEYTCMISLPGNEVRELVGSCHSVDVQLGLYRQPQGKGSEGIAQKDFARALGSLGLEKNQAGMLSNGGRFYIDPSGPEYDTPETTTAEEAVHRTFDGDEILLGVFNALRRDEVIDGFQINRRIVDHNRTSRGIHLNTMSEMPAAEPSKQVEQWLSTVNVVKGAIFGSGGLLIDEHGRTAFHHSPRLSITSELAASYSNYRLRPLVRFPFKPEGRQSRIETVTSDALSFAWPLRASLVLTDEAVRLIEMGYGAVIPTLRDPVRAAQMVGRYGNQNQIAVEKRNEEGTIGMRPLEVLQVICERILRIDDEIEHLGPEAEQVINEIITVIDKMKNDIFSVVDQVESSARLATYRAKMDRAGIALGSERMCRFDYLWDKLGGGIAEGLRQKNKAGWQGFTRSYSRTDTKRRITTPPQDTRAKIRGELIRKHRGSEVKDWSQITQPGAVDDASTYVHPLETSL